MFEKIYYTYILTNKRNNVFYIGVTNDIERRMFEYKNKLHSGFTSKYNVNKLVYYDEFDNPYDAICREKQLKGWLRQKKIDLIKSVNSRFDDLLESWYE